MPSFGKSRSRPKIHSRAFGCTSSSVAGNRPVHWAWLGLMLRRLFKVSEGETQVPFNPGVWHRGAYVDVGGQLSRVVCVEHDLRGPPQTTLHVRSLYPWEN